MDFNTLVTKLIRSELENFARGVSVNMRMCDIIEQVTKWRNDKPIGNSPMMSSGHQSIDDTVLDMVQMDTDAIVRGDSLKSRVFQLVMYANAWVHDRLIYIRELS